MHSPRNLAELRRFCPLAVVLGVRPRRGSVGRRLNGKRQVMDDDICARCNVTRRTMSFCLYSLKQRMYSVTSAKTVRNPLLARDDGVYSFANDKHSMRPCSGQSLRRRVCLDTGQEALIVVVSLGAALKRLVAFERHPVPLIELCLVDSAWIDIRL